MLNMYPMLLAWALVTASAPSAGAESTEYRRLTTSELVTLLSGSTFTQPDRQYSWQRTPEEFHKDGTYIRHADNFEGRGSYNIQGGSVCVTETREREICRQVMIDRDGQYWITKRNNMPGLIRISVGPIRK